MGSIIVELHRNVNLIVTAEPYFGVSQPSEMVVGQNLVRSTTQGSPEAVDVRYEAFPRSVYVSQVTPVRSAVYGEDKRAPLDLLEARNAVRTAPSGPSRHCDVAVRLNPSRTNVTHRL